MTPSFLQSFIFANTVTAIANALFLVATLFIWRFADLRLLRRKLPPTWKSTPEEINAMLEDQRKFYRYTGDLPVFVTQGLLWKITPINSAPTLGSVVLTLVVQSLPCVSMAVLLAYLMTGFVQLVTLAHYFVVKLTPVQVKRALKTPLF